MNHLVVALLLATAGTAAAQPAETPAKVPTATEWYGWQILGADAAVFTTAGVAQNGVIAFGWIGSVLMRTAFPITGIMIGVASARGCSGEWCGFGQGLAGGLIGMGAAEVIDLVDATDEREIVPVKAPRWQPVAKVNHSTATFGVAARF